jgi:DNA-binding transcriptional LysR family regulator
MDSGRAVLAGELQLALVTAPPDDAQITKVPFSRGPLYAVIPRNHSAAEKGSLALRDLADDEWIVLAKNVHPIIHDAIFQTAQFERIAPKDAHDVMTSQQAVHLVAEHVGVAILTKPAEFRFQDEGVVIRPLSDSALWFETCLILRAEEKSRVVNEFARAFLRKFAAQVPMPKQMQLPLPA